MGPKEPSLQWAHSLEMAHLTASVASHFLYLGMVDLWCNVSYLHSHRVERITMQSPFQVGFSAPVATCLTQTVSPDWNKGKLQRREGGGLRSAGSLRWSSEKPVWRTRGPAVTAQRNG